jgi:hypothetical protein
MAGACSGLFSVSMFLLAGRVTAFYDYLRFREDYGYNERYGAGVEDLWWIPVVAWHLVLSIVGSLLIHRYLPAGRVSTFLRWQVIGFVVLIGWALSLFTAIGVDCLVRGSTWPIGQALGMFKFISVAQFVAAVFASNVLYGTAVQVAAENLNERTQTNESEA